MHNQGLVSIIVPVYNGADHIRKSINSIIAQDYTNLELIIVNDCSTDNTLSIINEYAKNDNRIKVISNATNLKLPKTLNIGFSNANGQYLTWTSDDNVYRSNAISTMVDYLKKNPNVDMVYSNYTTIDNNDNVIESLYLDDPDKIVSTNPIGACFLYTKNIADEVGEYDSNLFLAEDYDYWIRIYCAGKITHINCDLYMYRLHAASLTETKKNAIQMQTYRALEKNFLTLYSIAYASNQIIPFFDHMVKRAGKSNELYLKNNLCRISSKYKYHLIVRKCKLVLKKLLSKQTDM